MHTAIETQRSELLINIIPYSGEFSSWDKILKAVVIFTSETFFFFFLLRALHCTCLGTPYVFVGNIFVPLYGRQVSTVPAVY